MANVSLQFNVLTTRRTRYIPTQQDLEEKLKAEYGDEIDFKVEVCLTRPPKALSSILTELNINAAFQ